MFSSRRPLKNARLLLLLAGCAVALLALVAQVGGFTPTGTAYGAPASHLDPPTDTPTASPTATTPANPPTLSLAVPSSGQGPVGAHMTLTGANWGTADVLVGLANPGASCSNTNSWVMTFNHVRPQPDQSIIYTFDWPASLTSLSAPYSICGTNNTGTASASYTVLASSPPSITLDPAVAPLGTQVKIQGSNFVGSGEVTITVTDPQGETRTIAPVSPDGNGNFQLPYQPQQGDLGDEVIHAATIDAAPQGMTPALKADAKLHVGNAPTPTVAATPTTVAAAPTPNNNQGGGLSGLLVVGLILAFVLALLIVGGVGLYFYLRRRNQPGDDGGPGSSNYGGYGGYGGYGSYGSTPGYDPNRGNVGGVFANESEWDSPTQGYQQAAGYPDNPYYGSYGGAANDWPQDDEPDPNWRPRPMTGQWRAPEQSSGGPRDPWANPDDSYGQPPRSPGSGQYGAGGGSGYGGPPPGYGNEPPPGPQGPGGYPSRPGGTRPGSGPRSGYPPSDPRSRGSGTGYGRGNSGGYDPRDPRDPQGYPPDNDW